jgi:hypothetical protein
VSELIVHFAYRVIAAVIGVEKLKAFVNNESEHHPEKVYPVLIGAGAGKIAKELPTIV